MVNIKTCKHVPQKRISGSVVRCSEEQIFQNSKEIGLSNVIRCGCMTAIFYQNIPTFHIFITRRSDFQTEILKTEIHNNYIMN